MSDEDTILRHHRGVAIVKVKFLVDDRQAVREAMPALHRAIEDAASRPKMILDFDGLKRMSSRMLGDIMALNLRIARQGGRLRLCNIDADIEVAFALVKFDRIMKIDETLDDAMEKIWDDKEYEFDE